MPQFKPLMDDAVALRPLEPQDVNTTAVWRNDPLIRDQVLSFRFPVSHVMETKFIERAINGDGTNQWVAGVVDRADGTLCGMVYLRDIDWVSRNAAFGMVIGNREKQGRGIGGRALKLTLHQSFNVLNLGRIYLYVVDYNNRAKQLYLKAGFRHEGTLRRHVCLEGEYHDLWVMGLMLDEYSQACGRTYPKR